MRPFEPELAKVWAHAIYGDWTRYIWEEGMSEEGRKLLAQYASAQPEVRHYRVFCDPAWQPLIPHGVRQDARPAGWQSRLDPDRWELVVTEDGAVVHLHEFGPLDEGPFPRFRKRYGNELDGRWEQANVYIHIRWRAAASDEPHFEDSIVGRRIADFIRSQR